MLIKLEYTKLFLNLKKYKFNITIVKFLSFIIKPSKIKINKAYIKAIMN